MFTPLFIDAPGGGQRFAIHHPAQVAPGLSARGLVVYAHPFAEEMNRCRRMAAIQSRALAASGLHVLQIDLKGCGDSTHSWATVSWQDWLDDIELGVAWLRSHCGRDLPLWLWGLRAGALVHVAAASRPGQGIGACHFLLCNPIAQGRQQLQQFLRLRSLGEQIRNTASTGLTLQAPISASPPVPPASKPVSALHEALENGYSVEVAGYTLSPNLAQGLRSASLIPPPLMAGSAHQLAVIDVAPAASRSEAQAQGQAPAHARSDAHTILPAWQAAGWQVDHHVVNGPAYWQTPETDWAPEGVQAAVMATQDRVTA